MPNVNDKNTCTKLAECINGLAEKDFLLEGAGNGTLNGGEDNNTLNGCAGIDSLAGGAGDNLYTIEVAEDILVEENGIDTVLITF
jgi:Ca2+-binding RTX toxin-like protein